MKSKCIVIILGVLCCALNSKCVKNNVCPTLADYYTVKDNPHCWYDIAAEANVVEIIKHYGYPIEEHSAITPDGYILTMFRIPNHHYAKGTTAGKGPVFLQHGWLFSSASFVALGNQSLAFTLADAGYDIWLGNFRSTEYTEGHISLTVYDKKYWDYSADHIGIYDVPTQLEYVAQKTGQRGNIVYVGHSLSTFIGLIYASSYPEESKNIVKSFIMLAPLADLTYTKSVFVRSLPLFIDLVLQIIDKNDLIRIVSQTEPLRTLFRLICLKSPLLMQRCWQILNVLILGPKTQTALSTLPVIYNQFPSGISFRILKHAAGVVKYGRISKFDYGLRNQELYGTPIPPPYNISNIEVPIYMMYSVGDWGSTKKDALSTYNNRLSSKAKSYGIYEIGNLDFNHFDFVFGKHAKTLVYDPILHLLEKINFR